MSSIMEPSLAIAFARGVLYTGMLVEKSAAGNYKNYLVLTNGDTSQVGPLIARLQSISALLSFLLVPTMTSLSDVASIGRKKVLLAMQVIMSINWYYRDATISPYAVVILCRLTNSLAHNTFNIVSNASLSDLYSGTELATARSSLSSAVGVAYVIGPLLVPIVTSNFGSSVRSVFLVRSGTSVLIFAFLSIFYKETLNMKTGKTMNGMVKKQEVENNDEKTNSSNQIIKKSSSFNIKSPLQFLKLFTSNSKKLSRLCIVNIIQQLFGMIGLAAIFTLHNQQILKLNTLWNSRIFLLRGLLMIVSLLKKKMVGGHFLIYTIFKLHIYFI